MRLLKQNTATNLMIFMSDILDHSTGKTGLTLSITLSKDGASFAAIAPVVTERGSGWYNIVLTDAMVDTLGDIAFHITGTGADSSDFLCRVVPGSLDADISTRMATFTYTAPDNSSISAIKAKTDNIPAQPATADQVNSRLAAIDYTAPDNSGIQLVVSGITSLDAKLDVIASLVTNLESYDDTDLMALVNSIRKITLNKAVPEGDIVSIFEDDGFTVWKQFNLSNGGRVEV